MALIFFFSLFLSHLFLYIRICCGVGGFGGVNGSWMGLIFCDLYGGGFVGCWWWCCRWG